MRIPRNARTWKLGHTKNPIKTVWDSIFKLKKRRRRRMKEKRKEERKGDTERESGESDSQIPWGSGVFLKLEGRSKTEREEKVHMKDGTGGVADVAFHGAAVPRCRRSLLACATAPSYGPTSLCFLS